MHQSDLYDYVGRNELTLTTVVFAIAMMTPGSAVAQNCRLTTYSTSTTVGSDVTITPSNISSGSQCQLSITSASDPTNGNTRISRGSVIFSSTSSGYANFFVQVSGSVNGRTSVSINVKSDDPPDSGEPPQTSNDNYSVREGEAVSGNVLLNDADPDGDPLTASLNGRPSSGKITSFGSGGDFRFDTNGDFNHLHSGDTDAVSFTYEAADGTDGSNSATVNITIEGVNDSPWAHNLSISLGEDETASISVADEVGDSDHSVQALSASVASAPSHGSVRDQGDDLVLKYEPDDEFSGSDEFTYEVSDGGKTATGKVSLAVNAKNDAPSASATDVSTREDHAVTIDVSDSVTDPDHGTDQLSVTATESPAHGSVQDSDPNDLTFTYKPDPDYNGLDNFKYQVTDGAKTNSARVDVSVEAVPDVKLEGGEAIGFEPRSDLNTGLIGTPLGVIKFSADSEGFFSTITLTNESPGIQGMTQIRVYPSSSDEINTNASPIVEKDVDPNAAPAEIVLDLDGETIKKAPGYLFVTAKVREGASSKLNLTIESRSEVSFKGAGTLNTSASASFPIELWKGEAQLPVELANFEGRGTETGISLKWRTASEQNNAGFEVQRRVVDTDRSGPTNATAESASEESTPWQTVGRRDGAGTTDQPRSYRFTDTELPYAADSVRYRLKQIDTDGSSHLSDPVTVARSAVDRVQLKETYPNPASGRVTVRYGVPSSTDGHVHLRLYDMLGRAVRKVSAESVEGRTERQIDVSTLSSGVYILRLRVGTTARTQRLTVVQ